MGHFVAQPLPYGLQAECQTDISYTSPHNPTPMAVLPCLTLFEWRKCLQVTLLLLLAVDFLILPHDPREQLIAGLLATGVRGYSSSSSF